MPQPLKVVISAILIAFFLSLSASIEAEAAGIGDYEPLLLPRNEVSLLTNRGTNSNIAVNPGDVDVYAFVAHTSNGSQYGIFLASPALAPSVLGGISYPSVNLYNITLDTLDEDTLLHYRVSPIYTASSILSFGTPLLDIPQYDTIREGLDAISASLTPAARVAPLEYNLQSGYALVLDIEGLDNVAWSSETTSVAGASPAKSLIVYTSDAAPVVGGLLPDAYAADWVGYGKQDVYGRYTQWRNGGYASPQKYLIIANVPTVGLNGAFDYINVAGWYSDFDQYVHFVRASGVNVANSYLVPLRSAIDKSKLPLPQLNHYYGERQYYFTPPADDAPEDTPITTPETPEGQPYVPTPGGDTVPPAQTSTHGWLANIAQQLADFFGGAITAITTLTASASQFFTWLGAFFTWLPPEVYSILISGLILAIIIGVAKHLL